VFLIVRLAISCYSLVALLVFQKLRQAAVDMITRFLGKGRTALDTLFLDAEELVDRGLKTLCAVPKEVSLSCLGGSLSLTDSIVSIICRC